MSVRGAFKDTLEEVKPAGGRGSAAEAGSGLEVAGFPADGRTSLELLAEWFPCPEHSRP